MGFRLIPLAWGRSTLATLACAGMTLSPVFQLPLMAQQPVPVRPSVKPLKPLPSKLTATPLSSPAQVSPQAPSRQLASNLSKSQQSMAFDVALDASGSLRGEVRNAQGKLEVNSDVVLWQGMQMLQRTRTDAQGRFQFVNLGGGQYRIATPDVTIECRAWTAKLAPPKARQSLLVVANMYSARGQQPINEVFCFNPFLMGTIVAAAIAIPIAVHDSGDGELADGS